jgi:4-hydroxy-tetrahydrodipicolinate synthase
MDQVSALKAMLPENFYIFSGDDGLTLPMLALGAHGVISVAAHIVAKEMREMIESYIKGDVKKAQSIHLQLFPIFKALFITANPIPVKKALALLGRPSGKLRLPLVEATVSETEVIADAMKKVGVL